MRLLCYADLQADITHEMCFNDPGLHLQIYRVRKFYKRLKEIYDEHACDALVDLGDTFDDRTSLHYRAVDAVLEGLSQFPDHPFNIKLMGNHEQHQRDCSLDLRRLFDRKFTVVQKKQTFDINDDTMIFCAAYPASDEEASAWLQAKAHEYRGFKTRLLLGHFQVLGSKMPSGSAVSGIHAKYLRPFQLALLGHVHRPQQIGSEAFYVGSPFQQNFGEKGEDKRVGIVEVESGTVKWVPMNDFPEYRVCGFREFLELCRAEEEHRYQVYLRSPEHAERYYAHPLMNRAEAIYDYQLDAGTKAETQALTALTLEGTLRRYVGQCPAQAFATPEDLVEYGLSIAL